MNYIPTMDKEDRGQQRCAQTHNEHFINFTTHWTNEKRCTSFIFKDTTTHTKKKTKSLLIWDELPHKGYQDLWCYYPSTWTDCHILQNKWKLLYLLVLNNGMRRKQGIRHHNNATIELHSESW